MQTQSNTYFIASNVHDAGQLVESLQSENLSEENIGIIGKRETLAVAELPDADLTEKSNVLDSAKRGATVGVTGGLLAGLAISSIPTAGLSLGGSALVAMSAGGAALGTWAATLIGVSEKSPLSEKFEQEIEEDKIVVLANIEGNQESISQRVAKKLDLDNSEYGSLSLN